MAFRILLLIGLAAAQTIDIAKYRVDPSTFLFEDGRTRLSDYITAQMQTHSNCCGIDGIYVELRITPDGTLESVRALTGQNNCYKKSVIDILRPLRWKAEGFQGTRTLYYELRFSIECKGTENDNVYAPIPAPGATVASATSPTPEPSKPADAPRPQEPPKAESKPTLPPQPKPGEESPRPIPATPPLPGQTEPRPAPEAPPPTPRPKPAPKEQTPPARKEPPSPPAMPQDKPARKDYQPGPPPPTEPGKPRPPAVVGPLPSDSVPKPLQVQVPKKYQSTGEKRPPEEHIGSYANTTGPRYAEPDYINGPIAKALYLKKAYKEGGACGLVHVLLEVAIDPNGQVRGYRILAANTPKAAEVTPKVLQGLRYKPVPLPMVFYTEFKIDVDCQSDRPAQRLDTIPDYLVTPESKLIRPPAPKP